jgi:hypothetical protein
MVIYTCDICKKEYSNKTDYNRHIGRKNKCKSVIQLIQNDPVIDPIVDEKTCMDCKKKFSNKSNLRKHINDRCKKKINIKESKIEILEKKIEELTSIVNVKTDNSITNSSKTSNKWILNSNSNNNIINNNNIKLLKFGEEDMEKITQEVLKYMSGYEGFYKLIKDLHFDEEKPENHNIYISNSKLKNVCVYDGTRWLLRNLEEVREELVNKNKDYLCDRFDILKAENKISDTMEKKFARFCKNYMTLTGKKEKDFKESIDLILYNNRDIPIKTKKVSKPKVLEVKED